MMKKIFLVASLTMLTLAAFAQPEKEESPQDINRTN